MPRHRDPDRPPTARTKPATRVTTDTHAFLQDEKFNTMLDLEPLRIIGAQCEGQTIWTSDHFKPINHLLSADSICLLHQMGITPAVVASAKVTPLLPAMLMHHTLTTTIMRSRLKAASWRRHMEIVKKSAKDAFYTQLAHLLSNTSDKAYHALGQGSDIWETKIDQWPSEIVSSYLVSEDMMSVLELNRMVHQFIPEKTPTQRAKSKIKLIDDNMKLRNGRMFLPSIDASIVVTHNLCILSWKGHNFLLTHQLLLECVNKLNELYCAVLYTHLIAGTALPDDHWDQAMYFWRHISHTVQSFYTGMNYKVNLHKENLGFTYLKIMEGLGVSALIYREDTRQGWMNRDLINNLWGAVLQEQLVAHSIFDESHLGHFLLTAPIASIAELIGTVKLCGHPSIEVFVGLEKLEKRTHEQLTVDPVAVNRSVAVMQRDLTLNFYRKHRKYPVFVNLDDVQNSNLKRLISQSLNPASAMGKRLTHAIPLEEWATLRYGKNQEFDPIDNQLVLLKDKALGLQRSKVLLQIAAAGVDERVDKRGAVKLGSIETRRALLAYLLTPHFTENFRRYLDLYMSQDEWSESVLEYMVIKLTAKELEEKPEGRMFGASPSEERSRRIVQEKNVMTLMDTYTPDQLMTPDELSMIRKLYSFRHFNHMYPNHKLIQVSFDFSKWNNSMRVESVDVPAKIVLDGWFGTNFFGKTMKAYNKMVVYYADSMRAKYWDGQLGGIEGLNQATWSFVFLGGIKQALDALNIKYQITVKGDDVRAVLAVPNADISQQTGIEAIRDQILTQLQELCSSMGWSLNPQECFVSLSVICTSKQYQINDTWMGASTKKAMKLTSLADLLLPTMEDLISSIFSTAHSSCSQTTTVFGPFVAACLVAARELAREYVDSVRDPIESITMLILWPQCIGGPGSLPLQTFMVRGENDMLSVSLSLMRFIIRNDTNGLRTRAQRILSQKMTLSPDPTLLLSDPYAVPLTVPQSPKAVLKTAIKTQMPRWVENPDLLTLMDSQSREDEKNFQHFLCSMRPYLAKVATTFWECSPFYIMEEVLGRFTESSTVFAFLSRVSARRVSLKRGHKMLERILMAAKKRHRYWITVLSDEFAMTDEYLGVPTSVWDSIVTCTTEIVQWVRRLAWGFDVGGITYPSLVDQNLIYHPNDLTLLHPGWDVSAVTTSIMIPHQQYESQTEDNYQHYATIPNQRPWLGAQTSSHLQLPTLNHRVTSPTIGKLTRLLNLYVNGHILGPSFMQALLTCMAALTPIPIGALKFLTPEAGSGHIAHRTSVNACSLNTTPNFRPNIQQLVMIPNDAGGALRGDSVNRTVNFAARNYYINFLAVLPLQSSNNLPQDHPNLLLTTFHYNVAQSKKYTICDYCCADVDETAIDFQGAPCPDLARYVHVPLVGCTEYENTMLRENMQDAMESKARRYAIGVYADPHDPRVELLASLILIRKFGLIKKSLFEAAQEQNYTRVPTGALLEAVAVNLNIRQLRSVSINSLRCMKPLNLYRGILHEFLDFTLTALGSDSTADDLVRLEHIMPHLNPLVSMFGELGSCDLLLSVQQGARIEGLLPNFTWTSGCGNSAAIASSVFVQSHLTLVEQWLYKGWDFAHLMAFIHMEDDITVEDKLRQEYRRVKRVLYVVPKAPVKGSPLCNIIVDMMVSIGASMWLPDKAASRWSVQVFNASQPLQLDVWNEEQLLERMYGLHQRELLDPRDSYYLDAMNRLVTLILLDQSVQEGSWLNEGFVDVQLGQEYTMVRVPDFGEATASVTPWYARYVNEEEMIGVQYMVSTVGTRLSQLLYTYVCSEQYFENVHSIDRLDAMWEHVGRVVKPINTRVVGVMRDDDAERLVAKQDGKLAQKLDDIREQLIEQAIAEPTDVNLLAEVNCKLGSQRVHDALYDIHMPQLYSSQQKPDYNMADPIAQCSILQDKQMNYYWLDPTEYMRCVGVHNTSSAKYIELLNLTGVHSFLSSTSITTLAVCLADGLGGLTAQLLSSYKKLKVLYNSMYLNSNDLSVVADADINNPPIEVMSLPNNMDKLSRVVYKGLYPGDLLMTEVQSLIVHTVKAQQIPVILMTCDADIPWSDNMETAWNIWTSVLRIHIQTCNEFSVLIVKCFCVEHPKVREFLHLVGALYTHFHFERSRATRTRSTEFFVIAKELRDPNNALQILENILNGKHQLTPSYELVAMISTSMAEICAKYIKFRRTGEITTPNLATLFDRYYAGLANPLNVAATCTGMGIHIGQRPMHLCRFLQEMTSQTGLDLRREETFIKTLLSTRRGRNPAIRSRTGNPLAYGSRFLQAVFRKIIRFQSCYLFFSAAARCTHHPFIPNTSTIAQEVITNLDFFVRPWSTVMYLYDAIGITFLVSEQFFDNVTFLVYAAIKKCMQVLGAWYYTMRSLSKSEMPFTLTSFSATSQVADCCFLDGQSMFRDFEPWQVSVRGVSMLDRDDDSITWPTTDLIPCVENDVVDPKWGHALILASPGKLLRNDQDEETEGEVVEEQQIVERLQQDHDR